MEHSRPLSITNLSATDLEDIRFIGKMKVYAVVSVTGGPPTEQHISEFKTPVDMEGVTNPKWDSRIDFTLHDPSLQNNLLYLHFNFHCSRTLGDKHIGVVRVPVKPLFDMISAKRTASETVKYSVEKSSGGEQGFVHFCFAFGAPIQPSPQQPTPPYTPQPQVVSKTQAQQVSGNSPNPNRSRIQQPVPNQANYSSRTIPANDQRNFRQQPPPPSTPQSQVVLGTVVEQVSGNIPIPFGSKGEQPVPNQANYFSGTAPANDQRNFGQEQPPPYTPRSQVVSGNVVEQASGNIPNPFGSTIEQPVPNQANYFSGTAPVNDQRNLGQEPPPPYTPRSQVVSETVVEQASGNIPNTFGSTIEQPVPNQANYFSGTAPANDQRNFGQEPPPPFTPLSQVVSGTVVEQASGNIPTPFGSTIEQSVPNQANYSNGTAPANDEFQYDDDMDLGDGDGEGEYDEYE